MMKFVADFHIHSKYSRATSQRMDLEHLDEWAKIKGILVLGTGDFTHPAWLEELKEKLEPAESGLFRLKNKESNIRFLLTSEISCIYSKRGRVRKIHLIVFAPSFSVVEKINVQLGWIGNLKSDGRPILGLDAKELTKIVLNTSENCLVVPAHCLLPDTHLHSNPGIKMIKDISAGDFVYTHKGKLRRVEKVYKRSYKGKIYNIKPYYFRVGLTTTPEHPFYAIKGLKDCKNCPHTICKPQCAYYKKRGCVRPYFKEYRPRWIPAKNIEKGDILIFPRFNDDTKNIGKIKLNRYLDQNDYKSEGDFLKPLDGSRANLIPDTIKIDKDFCRLIGYYLSEGYTDNRDSISFCFSEKEKKYIKDVKDLMQKIFGFSYCREYKRKNSNGIELIFFSKLLSRLFSTLFYSNARVKRAHTKRLPSWMLKLPLEKQAEIFKSWWRGDSGTTSSRILMNQMKMICLRLGIIPSIRELAKKDFNKKEHKIGNRKIVARHNQFTFSGLSFFEDHFEFLKEPYWKKFNTKLKRRHGWIDEKNIYIPVRDIEIKDYRGDVYNLEVENDNSYLSEFATVHNCWTPWFSLFGSRSGFDSIEECFEEYSKYIFAGETGLSSDPNMNWRLSALDGIALISNSDAHSPQKIGREANVFDAELSYGGIMEAIKSKDKEKFLYTIEFFPEEGKYHYDGHRLCDISLSPAETKKSGGICPVCVRPLTIGVLNRVEQLADREEGFVPERAIPFKSLIPLEEIIAQVIGVAGRTKKVEEEYQKLVKVFNNELSVLLDIPRQKLETVTFPEIAEGVLRAREGKVFIEPGYDGVYGRIRIFSKGEEKKIPPQKTLF